MFPGKTDNELLMATIWIEPRKLKTVGMQVGIHMWPKYAINIPVIYAKKELWENITYSIKTKEEIFFLHKISKKNNQVASEQATGS